MLNLKEFNRTKEASNDLDDKHVQSGKNIKNKNKTIR